MAKKEVTTVELKDKLGLLNEERQGIFETLKKEQRKANENEEKRLGEIASEVAEVEFEIKLAEARNRQKPVKTEKRGGGYSILGAVRELVAGRGYSENSEALNEIGCRAMQNAGVESTGALCIPLELRADDPTYIQATISGQGQEVVPTETLDILSPLRDRLVLVDAGAQFLTGLKGNITIPKYSGSTASWEGEVSKAKDGKGTFSKITMSPKRIATALYLSKQFLIQDGAGAETMLRTDIVNAIVTKLQSTIFGKHAHVDTMPDGFFTGTPEYEASGIATLANLVEMETAVDTDNALEGNLAYVTHTKGKGILKSTLKAANVAEGFLYEKGFVNDYKLLSTAGMASGLQTGADEYGIVFGNWADLVIGQWGALDITVDTITMAEDGLVKLVINGFFDVVKKRDESFAVGSLK